jgi:hypothetical protein
MKIPSVVLRLLHADRWMDRHTVKLLDTSLQLFIVITPKMKVVSIDDSGHIRLRKFCDCKYECC